MPTKGPPSAEPATVDAAFGRAVGLHGAGRVDEAEQIFRQILQVQPAHAAAAHYLAICLSQRGDFESSLPYYDSVLQADPNHVGCLNNLGNALQALRRFDAALGRYETAIALSPGTATFHSNRGNCLKELGRHDEALASYGRALTLSPDHATTYFNRGTLLHDLQRFDEALADFDKAVALRPDHAPAFGSRGVTLHHVQRYDEALADLDKAIALDPHDEQALCNRGNVLRDLGRDDEALASWDRAIALKPDFGEAYFNRGSALAELRRNEEAVASYDRAIALQPDIPYLRGAWLHYRMHDCNWADFDAACTSVVTAVDRGELAVTPFMLLPLPGATLARQQRCGRAFSRDKFPASGASTWRGAQYAHDRIRVAYVSADFRNHPMSHLIAGHIEGHDRAAFEVIGLYIGPPAADAWQMRMERAFDRFLHVSARSDDEIATLIRDLEIDISIDLMGHTARARPGIHALRPAPVQVSYMGYPGTMGAPFIDYLVADSTLIPLEHRQFYDEKIVCLPHSYQVNDSTKRIADRPARRAEHNLPEAAVVFCCFNGAFKITPDAFAIWMRLLHAVPGSVLWLLGTNPAVARNLQREATQRGVAPDRLVFAPGMPLADHLARHRCADLFLDTFPYNAHTTASDALWAGLPVLTCLGETFVGRVGASVLRAIGLPELITRTHAEYEALALELATHPERLAALRRKLAGNRTTQPLFDTPLWTRHVETAYRRMHARHHALLPPEHIVVEA